MSLHSTPGSRVAQHLDHTDEAAQVMEFAQADQSLSTQEQFRGVEVVRATPDEEVDGMVDHWSKEDEARKQVPVFAYPESVLGKDFLTHPIAGEGTAFVKDEGAQEQEFVEGSQVTNDRIPPPLVHSIHHQTHCVGPLANPSACGREAPCWILQFHWCDSRGQGGGGLSPIGA